MVLPEEPKADYLEDPTYLVTAKTADCKLLIYTRGSEHPGLAVEGCRSCLVGPHCNGRIEHPSGSMFLCPDPRTCQYPTGMVINIQHPLMESLFGILERAEREATGITLPKPFREKAHEELLETLRLNLIDLPEGKIDEKEMEEFSRPFAEEIVKRHAPFRWRAYHSLPVNVMFWISEVVCFCSTGFWLFRKCTQGQNPSIGGWDHHPPMLSDSIIPPSVVPIHSPTRGKSRTRWTWTDSFVYGLRDGRAAKGARTCLVLTATRTRAATRSEQECISVQGESRRSSERTGCIGRRLIKNQLCKRVEQRSRTSVVLSVWNYFQCFN